MSKEKKHIDRLLWDYGAPVWVSPKYFRLFSLLLKRAPGKPVTKEFIERFFQIQKDQVTIVTSKEELEDEIPKRAKPIKGSLESEIGVVPTNFHVWKYDVGSLLYSNITEESIINVAKEHRKYLDENYYSDRDLTLEEKIMNWINKNIPNAPDKRGYQEIFLVVCKQEAPKDVTVTKLIEEIYKEIENPVVKDRRLRDVLPDFINSLPL